MVSHIRGMRVPFSSFATGPYCLSARFEALQVRSAVYNGGLGFGFGQRFQAANDCDPALPTPAHSVKGGPTKHILGRLHIYLRVTRVEQVRHDRYPPLLNGSGAARPDSTPFATRKSPAQGNSRRQIDVHRRIVESSRAPSWRLVARLDVIQWSLVAHTNNKL